MKKPNHVAIDGDIIAFKAASAIEDRYIIVTHIPSGRQARFETRTDFYGHHSKKAGGWLADKNAERMEQGLTPFPLDEFEIEDDRDVEPVEHAYQICKQMIQGIVKACGAKSYTVVVEGEGNFRDGVATINKYKDREDKLRPLYLDEVKSYLINHHPSYVAEGLETDDVLSIMSAQGDAIQATVDKDAYQVVGWLFDIDKSDKPFEIKGGVGRVWTDNTGKIRMMGFKSLCGQLLLGDQVDSCFPRKLCNKRYGEKQLVKDFESLKTKQQCIDFVVSKYKEWYADPIPYTHWETGKDMIATWDSVLEEMGKLMYMLRSWDDVGFTVERFIGGDL